MIITTTKPHEGTVVGVAGDTLTTTCAEGKQHCHTVATDAKVTCDGAASKAADLKPGTPVRVTVHKDDKTVATAVESGKQIQAPATSHKETSMSGKIDQFCDRLRDDLEALDTRLHAVQASVRALPAKTETVLHADLAAIRSRVDGQVVRLEQARDGVKAWAAAKVAETREAVGDWQAKRETQKLRARSDRAEKHAADAVFSAAAAVDEAEAAILEAAVARHDAASAPSPAHVG